MRRQKTNKGIDRPLLISWMLLVAFGVIMIVSASSIKAHNEFVTAAGTPDDYWYLKRQAIWVFVSAIGLAFFCRFEFRRLKFLAFPALVIVIGLLAAVFLPLIGGEEVLGAKRWLNFGIIGLQPSEVTKLVLAVYLATWLERKGKDIKDFKYGFVPFMSILGIIILLLFFQEDLGTTIIICVMAVTVFFISGGNVGQLLLAGLAGGLLVYLLIAVRPFRQDRIEAWLHPQSDPTGIGYHVTQAGYAIGSGGLFGVGYGYSRQKYEYLPHAPTDSIFAIIAEEFGLLGSLFLVGLYVFLLSRFLHIARHSDDVFGQLLVVSLAIWIGFQAFINMGGMLRIIPLKGVPLPFVSYGGSSLLMCSCAVGIALNVSQYNSDGGRKKRKKTGTNRGRNRRSR